MIFQPIKISFHKAVQFTSLLAIILFSFCVHAETDDEITVEEAPIRRTWNYVMGGGVELRWVNSSVTQNLNMNWPTQIFFGIKNYEVLFTFEVASFSEVSGNNTLKVERKTTDFLLSLIYLSRPWKSILQPYWTVGVGGMQYDITTIYGRNDSHDSSQFYGMLSPGLGIKVFKIDPLWLSAEARLNFSERLDPSPSSGVLFRLGYQF